MVVVAYCLALLSAAISLDYTYSVTIGLPYFVSFLTKCDFWLSVYDYRLEMLKKYTHYEALQTETDRPNRDKAFYL